METGGEAPQATVPHQARNSAGERRDRAEKVGNLSISHYRGDLHAHTQEGEETSPNKVVETRSGSNCGQITLHALALFHAVQMKNSFLAVTDHSRDANPEAALSGITKWFESWLPYNDGWLKENIGRPQEDLTSEDTKLIAETARNLAEKVANYDDTRLRTNLEKIEQQKQELAESGIPFELIAGVEANLLPNGEFDSQIVCQEKFTLVNTAIHPDLDPGGYADIMADPNLYTDLIIKGIKKPQTNIIAHIGFGASPEFTEKLDWDSIAQAAIENDVAIEINIRPLMQYIYEEMMDYDKFPANDVSYRKTFEEKLSRLIPLLSSEKIRRKLEPYLRQGLKIAINADEHQSPFIKKKSADFSQYVIESRGHRFWRCLKMAESQFNTWFKDMGIKQEHIINTYPIDQLKAFLAKEKQTPQS